MTHRIFVCVPLLQKNRKPKNGYSVAKTNLNTIFQLKCYSVEGSLVDRSEERGDDAGDRTLILVFGD